MKFGCVCLATSERRITLCLEKPWQAVEQDPSQAMYYHNLGISLYHAGRLQQAVQVFRQALVLDPHLPHVQHMYPATLMELHEVDAGIEYLHALLSSTSEVERMSSTQQTRLASTLAYALTSVGRIEDASALLQNLSQRVPALYIKYALSLVPIVPTELTKWHTARKLSFQAVTQAIQWLESGQMTVPASVTALDIGGDLGYWLTYQVMLRWLLMRACCSSSIL